MGPAGEPIEAVFREERGRLLALLAARFGDLDLAEEVTAEALLAAVETWPRSWVLARKPLAWLATTARRKALDRTGGTPMSATKLATLHADAWIRRAAQSRSQSTSTSPTTGCSSCSRAVTLLSTWTRRPD